jgi:hypothetical protein
MNMDIALRTILYLFFLWIVVYYLWPDYRNDAFRNHVFSIRDRMFLYAAQGNITFDHPAYAILRNRMNTLLRHGHEFTLTRVALIVATHDIEKNEAILKWHAAVAELPVATQEKMKEFNTCVAIAVAQHILYCSFFRYMVLRPLSFLVPSPRNVIKSPKVVSSVEQLESQTIEREARLVSHPVTA